MPVCRAAEDRKEVFAVLSLRNQPVAFAPGLPASGRAWARAAAAFAGAKGPLDLSLFPAHPHGPRFTGAAPAPAMARRRAIRSSVGGWVENRPEMPPCSGLMMNRCAVAGLASAG